MTENEKRKPDYLKWWLVIVTIFSGIAFFITAFLFIFIIVLHYGFSNNYDTSFVMLAIIIGIPIGWFYTWKLRRNSHIHSNRQALFPLSLGLIVVSGIALRLSYFVFMAAIWLG